MASRLRRKLGGAKRRLLNARRELFPPKISAEPASADAVFRRAVDPADLAVENAPASSRLHAKLSESDLAFALERAEADDTKIPLPVPPGAPPRDVTVGECRREAEGDEQRRLDLMLAVRYKPEGALERTGLSDLLPPDEVHAMTHSPLSVGGSFYHADLVSAALESVGAPLAAGGHGLDFGCSSGRVVRVLAAAYPEVEWAGCDPNGEAVAWAGENLPRIDFRHSPQEPPLPYEDDRFAVAFGISIWSHYAEPLALRWYDEMWRILRPGGHLVSTTHGFQSIHFYGQQRLRSNDQLAEIRDRLYTDGYWYAAEFGKKGDWGVVNDQWGTSFVSPEWMLEKLCPKWELVEYGRARNERNQDVYVLRKPA